MVEEENNMFQTQLVVAVSEHSTCR